MPIMVKEETVWGYVSCVAWKNRKKVRRRFPESGEMPLLDFLRLKNVPVADRLYIAENLFCRGDVPARLEDSIWGEFGMKSVHLVAIHRWKDRDWRLSPYEIVPDLADTLPAGGEVFERTDRFGFFSRFSVPVLNRLIRIVEKYEEEVA